VYLRGAHHSHPRAYDGVNLQGRTQEPPDAQRDRPPSRRQPINGINAPQRPDCVAGHVRFELRNVVLIYPLKGRTDFRKSSRILATETFAFELRRLRYAARARKERKEKQRNKLFSTHRLRPRGLQRHLETTACDTPITLREGARVIEDSRDSAHGLLV
jgi:hypothetical protein